MSEKENELKEKGYYYCEKCATIPLVHIFAQNGSLKIFARCKCFKNLFTYESFNKLYFHKEKKDNLEELRPNKDDNEKINIPQKLSDYNKIKEEINKFNLDLKNNLIEHYTKKIKEIENIYENNKKINDNLEILTNNLISNYSLNEKHNSNISNILYNINMNKYYNKKLKDFKINDLNDMQFISYEKEAKNYFSNQHIISPDINEFKTIKYLSVHDDSVNCFLELKENIGVSCSRDSYIVYHDLTQMKPILKFKAHQGGVNYLIKTEDNLLISCGEDSSIKIWEEIKNEDYLNDNNKLKEIENKAKIEIKTDESMKKIIILENNNKFLTCSHKGIYVYEYDIKNLKINLVKIIKKDKIADVILFKNDKNNDIFIIGYTFSSQVFIMDKELNIIKEIKCETPSWQNNLVQINNEEIILGNNKALNIINVEKGIIKLSKQTKEYINCLFKLKDGSIIRGERDGIRRYSKDTLDELPPLIEPYDNYDDDHVAEQLNDICELKNGNIILCYRNGNIKLGMLKIG